MLPLVPRLSSARSAWKKFGLVVLIAGVFWPVSSKAQGGCGALSGGQVTCSSNDIIQTADNTSYFGGPTPEIPTSNYPDQINVPYTGTVTGVQITLKNIDSYAGSTGEFSLFYTQVVLVSPGGKALVLLGGLGQGTDAVTGLTMNIADGNQSMPYQPPAGGGSTLPTSGSKSYEPTDILNNEGQGGGVNPALPGTSYTLNSSNWAQPDGSATLSSTFSGSSASGDWKLYLADWAGDAVVINGWTLTLTIDQNQLSTVTTVSGNTDPATAGNSVTYTATVTSGGSPVAAGGTVAFYGNSGSSLISGCSAQPVNGSGQATCAVTLTAGSTAQCESTTAPTFPTVCQGGNTNIVATYSGVNNGSGDYSASTSSGYVQWVGGTITNPQTNQYCNTNPIYVPTDASATAYPSYITVSGYAAGTTVGSVSVQLEGITLTDGVSGQFLLVAPSGQNLDFLDDGFASGATTGPMDLNFIDTAGEKPDGETPTDGTKWEAYANPNSTHSFLAATGLPTGIPSVPGSISVPPSNSSNEFTSTFNNAPANGNWALYVTNLDGAETMKLDSGWCITLTPNTGAPTATAVTPSVNPATVNQSVTYTATVTSGGNLVTSGGTVTFLDNGAEPGGTAEQITLSAAGTASFSSSSLYDQVNLSSSTADVYEGDHTITADYGGSGSDNPSSGSMVERINHATTFSAGSGGSINACNAGPIYSAQGNQGAFTPNPSIISVAGMPGTVQAVTLTLENLFTYAGGEVNNIESLLEGPTGAALDFFSGTGGSNPGALSLGNYTFSDSATSAVPASSFAPGTYLPTSELGGDSYTSGYYTAPNLFTYAAPIGSGTFAQSFANTIPNGNWALFFNMKTGQDYAGATGGWCLNFTQNPVTVSATLGHSGSAGPGSDFAAGEQNAGINIGVYTASNTGSTGDPTGTNPLRVTDTLPSGLSYVSFTGTDWACSASGQAVTCTSDDSVAQGNSYPPLTLNVNVASNASGTLANSFSVSGAGITSANSNTDSITVSLPPSLGITVSHSPSTFTEGQNDVWDITVSNTQAGSTTSGTVTMVDVLPSGYLLYSYSGTGWSCSGTSTVTCTSAQGVSGGSTYVPLALTVSVPTSSPASVSNTAFAYGGGDQTHTSLSTAAPSNTDTVTVQAPVPAVTQISPSSGVTSGGTAVNITGNNFIGVTAVNFGSVAAASFTVNSATSITAISPSGAGTVDVTVITSGGTSLTSPADQFAYFVPVATSLTPAVTPGATFVYANQPAISVAVSPSAVTGTLAAMLDGSTSLTATATGGGNFSVALPAAPLSVGSHSIAFTFTGTGAYEASTSSISLTVTTPAFVVNTSADDAGGVASNCTSSPEGTCSLRDALAASNAAGKSNITFDAALFAPSLTITLTNGSLNIASNTTITGPNASVLTVSGNNAAQVFNITGVATASIAGMTISNGADNGVGGGGIYSAGVLTLSSCAVTSNQETGSGLGGGIYNASGATLTMNLCTVSNNVGTSASTAGHGGGLINEGTATITNSTFSANVAAGSSAASGGGRGGAIYNGSGATLAISDSTLAANQVTDPNNVGGADGAAIFNVAALVVQSSTISGNNASGSVASDLAGGIYSTSSCTLANTILAGNTAAGGDPDGLGAFTDGGYNLIGNGAGITGITNGTNGDLLGNSASPINPVLSALGNYGGSTQTMLPLPGSPAICAGTVASAGVSADQRGNMINAGGYCPSGSADEGAVQTDYTLSWTAGTSVEPANVVAGATMSPAPAVTLRESGAPFADNHDSVAIGLGLGQASGGTATLSVTSASTDDVSTDALAGVATFSNLSVSAPGTGDALIASVGLNSTVTPAVAISATSAPFQVEQMVTLSPASLPGGTVGAAYAQTISAVSSNPPYILSVSNGSLPPGLSLSSSGELSGTPTAGGSFTFSIKVTDSANNTGTQSYTLTIAAPTIAVSPSSLPTASRDSSYGQTVTASGGTAPYRYAIASGALPAGLTLSSSGVLSGTPTVSGTFPFTITATDSSTGTGPYIGSQYYTLTISAPTITLTPALLPAGMDGAGYNTITLTASGGRTPYRYGITAGGLPAGLSLSSSGTLSGTPTAVGSFSFTITATDADNFTGSQGYTLAIAAPSLSLSPASLSTVTAENTYSETFTTSGGAASYQYTLASGSLPPGLTLSSSGALTGTPTATGNYTFSVRSTDSSTGVGAPFMVTRAYSLTVNQSTPSLSYSPSISSQTYGTAISSGALNGSASYNSASVAGSFAYTTTVNGNTVILVAGTTVLPVGTYTITATFTPSNTSAYTTASTVASYMVDVASATASVMASSRAYNGSTAATITGCTLTGVIAADAGNVTCSASAGSFATSGVANGITVTATGISLSGSAAGNYMLSSTTATTTANITSAMLILTANSATRVYGAANPTLTGTVAGQQNGDTFTEAFSTSATISSPVGAYSIAPGVAGTNLADYTQSITDGTLTVTQAASTTTLQASSTSITPGQNVALTATVADGSAGSASTPTGTVSFYDNGALLNATPATLSGGIATFTTPALTAGTTNNLTATYSGDVNFVGSSSTNSASSSINSSPLDFTMMLAGPSNLTLEPGQSICFKEQISPDYGSYAGTVNFTVSGLPPGAGVTFSPASVAANSGPQTVTVTITAASATAALHRDREPRSPNRNIAPFALAVLLLFGAGSLRKRGRALRGLLCVLVVVGAGATATMLSGCGSNGGFFAQAPQSYTVTITATSGNLQHSTNITLNLQ